MTLDEHIRLQKRFDKLFDRLIKYGLSESEKMEYFQIVNKLAESDRDKEFHALIESGDYRIGY